MKVLTTPIAGLLIIEPDVFHDERGYFYECYNTEKFREIGIPDVFMQDNESRSKKGVLRGMYFQNPPYEQGKLIRVVKGAIWDVAVDIRKSSPTYGKYETIMLSEENKTLFWIPPGFAHGFITLEEDTVLHYKCTNIYHKEAEDCLVWNDPDLAIKWPNEAPIVSGRDQGAGRFKDFNSRF